MPFPDWSDGARGHPSPLHSPLERSNEGEVFAFAQSANVVMPNILGQGEWQSTRLHDYMASPGARRAASGGAVLFRPESARRSRYLVHKFFVPSTA